MMFKMESTEDTYELPGVKCFQTNIPIAGGDNLCPYLVVKVSLKAVKGQVGTLYKKALVGLFRVMFIPSHSQTSLTCLLVIVALYREHSMWPNRHLLHLDTIIKL